MAFPLIAAGGMMAGSSILSGFFGSTQKKNEAAVAKYNAALMQQQAEAIKQKTKFQMIRQAEEGQRVQGELRAAIGGSGLVATQGAPLLALALQKSESGLQNYLIGYEGRIAANEALSGAQNYLMQAKAAKIGAKQSMISGFLGAGAALVGTWASMPGKTPTLSSGGFSYSSTANTASGRIAGLGYSSINLPSFK